MCYGLQQPKVFHLSTAWRPRAGDLKELWPRDVGKDLLCLSHTPTQRFYSQLGLLEDTAPSEQLICVYHERSATRGRCYQERWRCLHLKESFHSNHATISATDHQTPKNVSSHPTSAVTNKVNRIIFFNSSQRIKYPEKAVCSQIVPLWDQDQHLSLLLNDFESYLFMYRALLLCCSSIFYPFVALIVWKEAQMKLQELLAVCVTVPQTSTWFCLYRSQNLG